MLPVGEHGDGAGHGVNAFAAYGGLLDADRGVRGTGRQDAEDGGDLVGALGQGQRDGVALLYAVLAQQRGDPAGCIGEFAVGEGVAAGSDDGDAARLGLGEPEEPGVQGAVRRWRGRQGRHRASRQDVGGEEAVHRPGPGFGVGGQAGDEAAVGVERRVRNPGLQHAVTDVPVEEEAAVEFGDLGIQVDLGTLGDDPGGAAEGLLDILFEDLAQSDGAGVDDRGQHGGSLGAGEVAQHLHPAVRAVRDPLLEAFLKFAGLAGERQGRAEIRVEQDRAAEVADQAGDVLGDHLPVEEREVEQEAPTVAPGGDDFGEHGGEGGGGGDAVPSCGADQGGLVGGSQPVVQAA